MKWLLLVLIIITVLILIPPLHYGYIYPNQGDDTATHLIYFQNMDKPVITYYIGKPPTPFYPLYWGQYVTGRLMNVLPFPMTTSFFWFHFIVLILAVWSVGLSVGLAINPLSGVLAGILVFGRSFLLTHFYWGTIFDIVGVALLLPLLLLCLHKVGEDKRWYFGVAAVAPLFAVFHDNGQMIYALIPTFVAAELFRFRFKILNEYRMLIYCLALVAGLTVLFWLKFGIDYSRLWSDATIILAMAMAIIVGKFLSGHELSGVLAVALAVVISIPNTAIWFENHSALKTVDKQVIEYVNELPDGTFMVSPEVTENIYRVYLNKKLVLHNADYIIERSEAMTETSAIAVKHQEKPFKTDGYEPLKYFSDGGIEMAVYAR